MKIFPQSYICTIIDNMHKSTYGWCMKIMNNHMYTNLRLVNQTLYFMNQTLYFIIYILTLDWKYIHVLTVVTQI